MASSIVENSSQGSDSQGSSPAGVPARSQIVQRLLDASSSLPAFIHDLLTTVTRHLDHRPGPIRMGGASAGGVFDAVNPLRVSAGSFTTYASFR